MTDFEQYLHKAQEFYKRKNFDEAYNAVIQSVKSYEKEAVDTRDIIDCRGSLDVIFINKIPVNTYNVQEMYFLAGEMSSYKNEDCQALLYFQHYQEFLMLNEMQSISGTLYSFRPFSQFLLQDIVLNRISFSRPNVLNDPFDTPLIEWCDIHKDLHYIKPFCDSLAGYYIRSFIQETTDELAKGIKPVSNIQMWSHYANNHNGVCLEYEIKNTYLPRNQRFEIVSYKDSLDLSNERIYIQDAFATKEQNWNAENEVRLILYNPNEKSDFANIPMEEGIKLKSIYLGLKCSDNAEKTLVNLIRRMDIDLFKMKHTSSKNIYKLGAIPIPF